MCRVRLRRERHFGQDDPLYYPQPFSWSTPHLALILTPQVDLRNKFYPAWLVPRNEHFIKKDTSSPRTDLGVVKEDLAESIKAMAKNVLDNIRDDSRTDKFVAEGAWALQLELNHLDVPATLEQCMLRIRVIQRHVLELDARLRWLSNQWKTRVLDALKQRKKVHAVQDLMGAFVEKAEDADVLFHAGVPLWLVRALADCPNPRVDKLANVILEDPSQRIKLHTGYFLNCADEEPSNEIIYIGLANKTERYSAMARYMKSHFRTPSLFGLSEPSPKGSSDRGAQWRSTGVSEKVVAQRSTLLKRKLDYKPTKAIAKSSLGVTFMAPTSPLMPKAVAAWAKALSVLASRNSVPPRDNVIDGGFVVPPPRCIVSPAQEHIVATLFKSWLRVRDAVLSRLRSPQAQPVKLSNKCWRSLLDVSGGLHTGAKSTTRSGTRHGEMRDVLEHSFGMDKASSFIDAPIYWAGELITSVGLPDAEIAKAIVWELCEFNFRHELEALDGIIDGSGMTWTDRHALLNQCWVGLGNKVDVVTEANKGLGATCVMDRLPFLQILHKVMRTWQGVKPVELLDQFPEESSAHNHRGHVERIEFNLAMFYCESFLNVYGRAASIPHHL